MQVLNNYKEDIYTNLGNIMLWVLLPCLIDTVINFSHFYLTNR
jgi:hypothetical protein